MTNEGSFVIFSSYKRLALVQFFQSAFVTILQTMLTGRSFWFLCASVLLFFANKRADSKGLQPQNGGFKQLFQNTRVGENAQNDLKQNGDVHNNTAKNRAMTEVLQVGDTGEVQLNRTVTYPGEKVVVKIINCNQTDQTNQKSESHQFITTQKEDLEEITNDYHDNSEEYQDYHYHKINPQETNTPDDGDKQSFVSFLQLITAILAENLGLATENSTQTHHRPLIFIPGLTDDPDAQRELHKILVKLLGMLKTPQVTQTNNPKISYEAQQLLNAIKQKYPGLGIIGGNVQQQLPNLPFVQVPSLPVSDQQIFGKIDVKYPLLGLLKNNVRVQQIPQQPSVLLPQLSGVITTHRRIPQPNPITVHQTLEQILEDEVEAFKKVVKQKTQIPNQKRFNELLTTVETLFKPSIQTVITKPTAQTLLYPPQFYQVYDWSSKRPKNRHHKRRKYRPHYPNYPQPCQQSCPTIHDSKPKSLLEHLTTWAKESLNIPNPGGFLPNFPDLTMKDPNLSRPYTVRNPLTELLKGFNLQGFGGGSILNPTKILKNLVGLISNNLGLGGLTKFADGAGKIVGTTREVVDYAANPLLLTTKNPIINRVCTEYVYNNYPQTRPLLQNTLEMNRRKRSLQNPEENLGNLLEQFRDTIFPMSTTKTSALELFEYFPKFLEFVRKSLDWLGDDKNIQEYKAYFYMPVIFGVVVGVVSGATMVGFKTLTDTIKNGVLAMNPSHK